MTDNSCDIRHWYPLLKDKTQKSIFIDLPGSFVSWLTESDSFILPVECEQTSLNVAEHSSDDSDSDFCDDKTDETPAPPSFPELSTKIKDAIDALGGSVFVKLNWSSAEDATWITLNNSLSVSSLNDVYLLLKSSDKIQNDLKRCHRRGVVLCLRKFDPDICPSREFRVFVVNHHSVIAICQRDISKYHDYISKNAKNIVKCISKFVNGTCNEALGEVGIEDFVLDVIRFDENNIEVVDIAPFDADLTDSILFEWHDLNLWKDEVIEDGEKREKIHDDVSGIKFACVSSESGIQPNTNHNQLPKDFIDLSKGEDPLKLIDFLKLQSREQEKFDECDMF